MPDSPPDFARRAGLPAGDRVDSRAELKIATYLDVANFWQLSGVDLDLSPQIGENIEAVIVSFFSLCHAAELGTATVGKRGQPARLSVRLDQLKAFLDSADE